MNPNRDRLIALQSKLIDQLEYRLIQTSIADTVSCTVCAAIKDLGNAVEACGGYTGTAFDAMSSIKKISENGKAR